MALPTIFDASVSQKFISRINTLQPQTQALWGKMSVAQMLAHCCVTYEFIYEPEKHPKPNFFIAWVLKLFVKETVTNDTSYSQNSRTAPAFIITDEKQFNFEKERLIQFITKTQELGASYFEGKASHSFGILSSEEWNNMFYKHLDHHLRQFGV